MIPHPASGYNPLSGLCADRGDAGGYWGRFGQWRAWPLYNAYWLAWNYELADGISETDVAVYVYEDGSLIDTLSGVTEYLYPFDQNKHDVELVLSMGPMGWGEHLRPDELENTITLKLSHDNTATEMVVMRRSANGATWYFEDRLSDYVFELAAGGTYGARYLTASGAAASEIRGRGYALITMTTATDYAVDVVILGADIYTTAGIISSDPQHVGLGLVLSWDDTMAYQPGDSWRVDITLPTAWASDHLSRQEAGADGNAVIFRVDSTNDSGVTTAGIETAPTVFEAVDPAPELVSQAYLTGHQIEYVIQVGDLYQYHTRGAAVAGGTAQLAAYQTSIDGGMDAHYWPTSLSVDGLSAGDQARLVLDVHEGRNLIEFRSINSDGAVSDALKIDITIQDDAIYAPPNMLTRLALRKSGNTLTATTWTDTTMSAISMWATTALPWAAATSTTAVAPSAAGEEFETSATLPSGIYYVGMSSGATEPDVYSVIEINTIAPGGVVLDVQ